MKSKPNILFPSNGLKNFKAARHGRQCVTNKRRNYLTPDELFQFAEVDVTDYPALDGFQHLFMEQVFSSAHDEDMVPREELGVYRSAIAELLHRAGIAGSSKPNASFVANLGFRTAIHSLGEFRFVDSEIPNTIYDYEESEYSN